MEMPRRNQPVRNQTVRNREVRPNQQRHPAQRGFTLLELLVAIVVISILAAFLLPAIQGIVGTTKDAAVRNEISQMESAIATFKMKYGIEPPSGITLYEAATGWALDMTGSKALVQRMWPNFNFNIDRDINGDYDKTGVFALQGPECLVFFLGGVVTYGPGPDGKPGNANVDDDMNGTDDDESEYFYSGTDDTVALSPSGFSRNPTNPFLVATGTTAEGPFFEFAPSRLKPSPNPLNVNFKVYVDSLGGQTSPYLYLSSYDGKGYKNSDIPASTNLTGPYLTASDGNPHKQKSFQIISPGADTIYSSATGSQSRVYDTSSSSNNGLGDNKDAFDNITNFSSGRLKP